MDTSTLRWSLEENGIKWLDLTKLNQADNLIIGIDKALTKCDFVCAVLTEGQNSNVFMELGMAFARRKPILLVLAPSVDPPFDLFSFTYFRGDPTDAKIRTTLKTFLDHANRRLTPNTSLARVPRESRIRRNVPTEAGRMGSDYHAKTAHLFETAGFLVSASKLPEAEGVDFAVWIDSLPPTFGNPLLVEVKAGSLTDGMVSAAASRLREYVMKTQGRCALLVYWDQANRQFPLISSKWPLVFQLSGPMLEALLQGGNLIRELVRLRNVAAHGEV